MRTILFLVMLPLYTKDFYLGKKPFLHIIELIENGSLKERRYFDLNKKLRSIVFFVLEGKKIVQGDSLWFNRNSQGKLIKVDEYNFKRGRYVKGLNELSNIYYKDLFELEDLCADLSCLRSAYLLFNEITD